MDRILSKVAQRANSEDLRIEHGTFEQVSCDRERSYYIDCKYCIVHDKNTLYHSPSVLHHTSRMTTGGGGRSARAKLARAWTRDVDVVNRKVADSGAFRRSRTKTHYLTEDFYLELAMARPATSRMALSCGVRL